MKRILSLILTVALILSAAAAMAELNEINGTDERNITINKAGLNPSADEMIAQGISPTTGRQLDQIELPEGAVGLSSSKKYTPVMVQTSNTGGGISLNSKNQPLIAPIGMQYADVVYEALQARTNDNGTGTRFSAVYSDIIPYYAGFVRSTRLTHVYLRQEWNCAYCTSGYSGAYVPDLLAKLGIKKPSDSTEEDPGLFYVGDSTKSWWEKHVKRLKDAPGADSEVFELANIMSNVYPKYYDMDPASDKYIQNAPYNHTFRFANDVPETSDSAEHIEVCFGCGEQTDSVLEYDEDTNTYLRYVPVSRGKPVAFCAMSMINPQDGGKQNGNHMIVAEGKETAEQICFTNVIVQSITMNWRGYEQPDPELEGTGNADYFLGGKHYSGVWEREDINSRTVFYGADGNEITLLPGKTLIILMDYSIPGCSVAYE